MSTTNGIKIKYCNNYDIVSIHKKVLKTFECQSLEYLSAKCELKQIEDGIFNSTSVTETRQLKISKLYVMEKLERCNSDTLLKKYTVEASSYIAEYLKMPKTVTTVDAMNFDHMKSTVIDIKREKIVDAYLAIASKYIKLTITKIQRSCIQDICSSCCSDLIEIRPTPSGVKICYCGQENEMPKSSIIHPKDYVVWGNFVKTFKRNIGDVDIKIIDLILSDLDAYAEMNDKPTGEYYRSLPLDNYGFKKGTSVAILCSQLGELGYTGYYDNYAYIGHRQYGWALRTHLRLRIDELKHNFNSKQAIWDKMSPGEKEGDSSICNNYRLCREYQHLGERCRLRDFNVSCKRKTIEKYDRVYKKMCERAGFKFPHYVETHDELSSDDSYEDLSE